MNRARLRALGFDVDAKGARTKRLTSAIRAAQAGVSAKKWNQRNLRPGRTPIRDAKGNVVGYSDTRGAGSRRGGNNVADAGGGGGTGSAKYGRQKPVKPKARPAGGGGRSGGGGGGNRNLAGHGGGGGGGYGSANVGGMLSRSLSDDGAQLLGGKYADSLAGAQYDDAIHQLHVQQSRAGQQHAHNEQQIGSYYDQVQQALNTARDRNAADNAAAAGAIDTTTQRLVESLGGGANAGSGLVAAAGANDAATLRALGGAHTQYESDMAPLLAAESADARTHEQAAARNQDQDIANQLFEAQRGRGTAKANAMFDISKYNNDIRDDRVNRLMQIIGANNALAQTRFGNRMSIESARQAAALTGAKIADIMGVGGAGKNTWANMTPGDKSSIARDAAASVMGVDADGNPTGHVRADLTVPQIVKMVADQYRMAGFAPARNPAVRQNVFAVLRSLGIQPQKGWLRAPKRKKRR